MTARGFPPPWSVEEQSSCFVVRDHNGQALYGRFRDSHSHYSSLPLGRGRPLKTAKDYRAKARDDDVRAPLLQLAQTWLDADSKLDGLPANR